MKTKYLITLIFSVVLLSGCGVANELTMCTSAPQDEWLFQKNFQENLVTQGYQISKFKVTEGNCYEIYGSDPKGSKVEIYFNPVDGSVVKQKTY
jgi:hypothetical protein